MEDFNDKTSTVHSIMNIETVLHNYDAAFFLLTGEFILKYLNPAGEKLMGQNRQQLIGKNLTGIFPADLSRIILEAISKKKPHSGDYFFTPRHKWYHLTAYPADDHFALILKDIQDPKTATEKIAQNEQLQKIVDSIPHIAFTCSLQGDILTLNKKFVEYTGVLPEGDLLSLWFQTVHPSDADSLRETWQSAIRKKVQFEHKYRMRRKDGEYRWHLERTVPTYNNKGEVDIWVGTVTDIQDQVENEERLKKGKLNLIKIINSIPTIAFIADSHSKKIYQNDRWTEYTGLSQEEGLDDLCYEALHPEDVQPTKEKWSESLSSGQSLKTEYRLRNSRGEYRWHTAVAVPLQKKQGKVLLWIGTVTDIHDQKQAEERIRKSEFHWRKVLDNIPHIVFISTPEGQHIFQNERWFDYTGNTENESLEKTWKEKIFPDDFRQWKEHWEQALRSGQAFQYEYRLLSKSGEYRWHLANAVPMQGERDNQTLWVGTISDIHERKIGEEKLVEGERRLKNILDAVPHITWIMDASGKVLSRNKRWFEYTEKEESEESWEKAVHPDDLENAIEQWAEALEKGVICENTYRIRNVNGEYRWFLARTIPLRNKEDEIELWIGTATDIQEQKEAEEKITKSENQLKKILDTIPQIAWLNAPSGDTVMVNKRWEELTGHEHSPDTWRASVHPDDYHAILDAWSESLKNGTVCENIYRIRSKNGEYRWHIARTIPMYDESGEIELWVGTATDIHEQKQAEEEVKRSATYLNNILDTIPNPLWIYSSQNEVISYNKRWVEYTGEPSADWLSVIHPDDRQRVKAIWENCLKTGEPFEEYERIRRFDGEYRWFLDRTIPLYNEQQEIEMWLGTSTDVQDQKLAEEKLKENEHFLNTVLNTSPSLIFIYNRIDKNYVFINETVVRSLGFTLEYINGKDFSGKHFAPEDQINLESHSGTRVSDVKITDITGNERWFTVSTSIFSYTEAGQIKETISNCVEITSLKQAEQEAENSNYFVNQITRATPDIISLYDLNSRTLVYVNDAITRVLGYEIEKVTDKPLEIILEFIHPKDREIFLSQRARLEFLADEETHEIEYRTKTAAGRWIWLRSRTKVFKRDNEGNISQVVGVTQDITESKQAQKELIERNRLINGITQATPDIITLYDFPSSRYIYVNKVLYDFIGVTESELIEMDRERMLSFIHPDDRQFYLNHIDSLAAADDKHIDVVNFRIKTPNDDWIWIKSRSKVFKRSFDGTVVQIISVGQNISAELKAEVEARESSHFLNQVTQASPDIITVFDVVSKKYIYANNIVELFWGNSKEDFLKMDWETLLYYIHPEDRNAYADFIRGIIENENDRTRTLQVRALNAANEWIWLETRAKVFKHDEEGKPSQILSISRDVTSEKESAYFSNSITDATPDIITVFDIPSQKYVYGNKTLLDFMGITIEELTERPLKKFLEIIHPNDRREYIKNLKRTRISSFKTSKPLKFRVKSKGGEWVWFETRTTVFKQDENGEPLQLLNMSENITAEVKAEEEARKNEHYIQQISEASPDIVTVFDLTSKMYVYVNNALFHHLGIERNDLKTMNREEVLDFIHPDDHLSYVAHLDNLADVEDRDMHTIRFRAKKINDGWNWFNSRSKVFRRDDTGKVIQVISVCQNITAELEAEAVRRENERFQIEMHQKDEFFGIASHELKTPVTSVKASLQILKRQIESNTEPQVLLVFLSQALKQVNKLSVLINDLLDVTKIQAGKLKLSVTDFYLSEIITDVIHQQANHHEVILQDNFNQPVEADKARIEQVIVNFVSNAIKYSPGTDKVIVTVDKEDKFVKISVTDFGIGIPKNKLDRVFDRFYRADENTPRFTGLGLGLYISAEIIERHHGEYGVISEEGKGSTFWFTIPIKYNI